MPLGNPQPSTLSPKTFLWQADKLLSPEFQVVIEELIGYMHPERQIMLYSATFPVAVRQFKDKFLNKPHIINLMEELTLKGITQASVTIPTVPVQMLRPLFLYHCSCATLHHCSCANTASAALIGFSIFARETCRSFSLPNAAARRTFLLDGVHESLPSYTRQKLSFSKHIESGGQGCHSRVFVDVPVLNATLCNCAVLRLCGGEAEGALLEYSLLQGQALRPSLPADVTRIAYKTSQRPLPSSLLRLPVLLVASIALTPFCRLPFGVDMFDRLAYLAEPQALHRWCV